MTGPKPEPKQHFSIPIFFKDVFKPKFNFSLKKKKVATDKRYSVPTKHISAAAGKQYIQRAYNLQRFSALPKKYDPYIKRTARNLGMSEYFVRYLLASEQFDQYPVYRKNDRVWTVGFGHTNTAASNTNFPHNKPISLDTAFRYFEQDVRDAEKIARDNFTPESKKYAYDKFDQSFKEALIDIAYNRGRGVLESKTIYEHLRANFEEGFDNRPAAAVRTRQEFPEPTAEQKKQRKGDSRYDKNGHRVDEKGLRMRNIYRFLLAIRSLSGKEQLIAMKRFDRKEKDKNGNIIPSYYQETLDMYEEAHIDSVHDQIKNDWEAVRRAAEYKAQQGR